MTPDVTVSTSAESHIDGRNSRRLRNRDAVLDAAIEMFSEGEIIPAMDDVAERAAVSVRSVYRYFATRDALMRAALERLLVQAAPYLVVRPTADGNLAARTEHFCEQRLALYFRFAPLARVAIALGRTDPMVWEIFEYGRDSLRQQFADQFDTELGPLAHPERAMLTTSATMSLQFHSFEYMHRGCGFDAAQMHDLVVEQMRLHLSAV